MTNLTELIMAPALETSTTKETSLPNLNTTKLNAESSLSPNVNISGHYILETGASVGKSHKDEPIRKSSNIDVSHPGVAIPMTIEDIEQEIAEVNQKVKDKETSTHKEGISTWILLSGTNPTAKPNSKLPTFRGDTESKVDKIARLDEGYNKQKRVTTPKPDLSKNKNKNKIQSNGVTDKPVENSERVRPLKIVQKKKVEVEAKPKRKPTTVFTTTTAVPSTTASYTTLAKKEVPVPFLILEAKDAEFNLPQDRSPQGNKLKKPINNKNKKKNNKKNGDQTDDELNESTKNSTKVANKIKDNKPMTTKIYNYLAREVMPTVGVGLIGLVVTAGLAGYFFGPLGALRRSYDVSDRKDELYYNNNEEYAGNDGQSEEDVFGKVIAGMPMNSNYRNNIRYVNQRPTQYQQTGPKYAYPYNRYKNVDHQQPMPYINYQSHIQQPVYQKSQPLNPNAVLKKSISSPVFYQNPLTTSAAPLLQSTKMYTRPSTTTKKPITTTTSITSTTTSRISEASSTEKTAILYAEPDTPSPLTSFDTDKLAEFSDPNANELKRRSQFVVGSVLPDMISEEDDHQTIDADAVPVPEHGPRKRRKRAIPNADGTMDNDLKQTEDLLENLKQKISKSDKNDKIAKETKSVEYQISRIRRIIAEVKDIEQFQNEFHFEGKNTDLKETVSNGITHVQEDIKFINELLDNPQEIDRLLADRKKMEKNVNGKVKTVLTPTIGKRIDSVQKNTTNTLTYYNFDNNSTVTEKPTGLMGLLKLIELKAAFGINLMQSVKPAFDRAFQQVFNGTHAQ